MAPIVHGLEAEYGDRISFVYLNISDPATQELTPEDRCLNVMPLFHIHGLMAAVLA